MNFLTIFRFINILFLILILRVSNNCGQTFGQPFGSNNLIELNTFTTDSSQNLNSTQDYDRTESSIQTIFSSPSTQYSIAINENTQNSTEVNDVSDNTHNAPTAHSNSVDVTTTTIVNEFTEFPQFMNTSDILITDFERSDDSDDVQIFNTSYKNPEIKSITTEENTQSVDSTVSDSTQSTSTNILETSTQPLIEDTTIPSIRSEPIVLRYNGSNYFINSSNDNFDDNHKDVLKNNTNSSQLYINQINSENKTEDSVKTVSETDHNLMSNTSLIMNAFNVSTRSPPIEIENSEISNRNDSLIISKQPNQLNIPSMILNNNFILNATINGWLSSHEMTSKKIQFQEINNNLQNFSTNKEGNGAVISLNLSNETKEGQGEGQGAAVRTKESSFKTMCTFGGWSALRQGSGRFDVNNLEQANFVISHCSHLVYAFVSLDQNSRVVPLDPNRELSPKSGTFAKLNTLREQNPNLKIMLGVGGWDTPSHVWTYLLSNRSRRQKTVDNIFEFLKLNSFDGLVISWFYPGVKWRGGHQSDKQNLVQFLQDFKSNITMSSLELAIMGPTHPSDIDDGFDIPKVSSLVDYLFLMTYDYFGSWDSSVNHLSPLYPNSNTSQILNMNFTLHYWLKKGMDSNQIILGLATYGRSFTLSDPNNYQIDSLSIGPGISGPYTNRPGIIGFNEICELFLSTSGVKLGEDVHGVTPFIHLYDQWIGFEDELSIFIKTSYALDNKLKGIYFWTLDLDDFHNKCGWGYFPLFRAALQAIYKSRSI